MKLPDVNIFVGAYREDAVDHARHRKWLTELVNGDEPFGLSEMILSAFVRIVTNARIFDPPTPADTALVFADKLRSSPACVIVSPGARHWDIFSRLCREAGARGNLVADAYLAALAIESGSEWVTMDGDFARFPSLRWARPF